MLTGPDIAIAQSAAERPGSIGWPVLLPASLAVQDTAGAGRGAGGGRGAPGSNATGRGQGAAAGPEGATDGPVVTVPADRDRTTAAEMKKRYGEITALDFPQWTKDNFPGVTKMDLRSALFGDVSDDAMCGRNTFDPTTAAGKRWLDQLANKLVTTGTPSSTCRTTRRRTWPTPTLRSGGPAFRSPRTGWPAARLSASSRCG